MTASVRFHLTESSEEGTHLAEGIESFAVEHQLSARSALELQVVLDEIVVNIRRHGYKGNSGSPIDIGLTLAAGILEVHVEDEAPEFNPLMVPRPDFSKPVDERKPGGLGVYLMRRLMDEVHYERKDGKNCLLLRKRV